VPFHFAIFKSSEVIPVIYGYPPPEGLMEALNGRIILVLVVLEKIPNLAYMKKANE
jgi:hypothetical protein